LNHISLKEYAQYVAKVRKYVSKNISLEEAVTRAVDECIEEGILAEFLMKNKAEVIKVSIYEYDKEFEEKKLRKAEYEAGVEAGIELGERSLLENQIRKKLKKGKPIEQIADELEEAVTTIQRIIEETKKEN
jgi:DNA-binding NarL/FixJ family response regulator